MRSILLLLVASLHACQAGPARPTPSSKSLPSAASNLAEDIALADLAEDARPAPLKARTSLRAREEVALLGRPRHHFGSHRFVWQQAPSSNSLQPDANSEESHAVETHVMEENMRLIDEAWQDVRHAPLPGFWKISSKFAAGNATRESQGALERLRDLRTATSLAEWYFFALVLGILIGIDVVILRHLPEIERTHVAILTFWIVVSVAFCLEVWCRLGPREGVAWASGYILEIIFSVENVFVFNLVFHALATPRRLMRKALFVSIIGSLLLRVAFLVGLAETLYKLVFLPYILGTWLVYIGTRQVAGGVRSPGEDEVPDVTRNVVVRLLKSLLGERLSDFYDEEGEALVLVENGTLSMTLLGVSVGCLLASDFCFGIDAALVKLDIISNLYVSLSSSALALLTLRALFFVVRDIFSRLSLARYGSGIILFFIGLEMIVARFTPVSALTSLIIVANMVMLVATMSAVRDSACPKRVR